MTIPIRVDTNQLRVSGVCQSNNQSVLYANPETTISDFFTNNMKDILTRSHRFDSDVVHIIGENEISKVIDVINIHFDFGVAQIKQSDLTMSFAGLFKAQAEKAQQPNAMIRNVYMNIQMFNKKLYGFRINIKKANDEIISPKISYVISGDETLIATINYCRSRNTMFFPNNTNLCINGKEYNISMLTKDCFSDCQNVIEIADAAIAVNEIGNEQSRNVTQLQENVVAPELLPKKLVKKQTKTKSKIPATLRNSVWNSYIGKKNKEGMCFCCNSEQISSGNFECGHIVAESEGGEINIQNLRPICSLCNKSMGGKNMEDFMKKCGYQKNQNWDGIP